jgi:hypothetical protein
MKICTRCKDKKELSEFYKSPGSKDGYRIYCKTCYSKLRKRTYNFQKAKKLFLKSKYKITLEELEVLFLKQKKKCAICNEPNEEVSTRSGLHIDHDHVTGKVRGLLCKNCNQLIGNAKDNINILENSIKYLLCS